jgi:hypothetical protein
MTQVELRFLSTMPNKLDEIAEQLKTLNETMKLIAESLNNIEK